MTDAPLCSIIIPAYKAAAFLAEAIESALAQSWPAVEVIVVDDGSPDDSAEIASRYRQVRLIRQANRGLAGARNTGIRAARGAFLCFLDADDRLWPEALARLIPPLLADPGSVASYGETRRVAADGRPFGRHAQPIFAPRPTGKVLWTMLGYCFVKVGALVVQAEAIRAAGLFREELSVSEDWECWCRLAARGRFVRLKGAPMMDYRAHDASMMATIILEPAHILATARVIAEGPAVAALPASLRPLARRRVFAHAHAAVTICYYRAGRFADARQHASVSLAHWPFQPRQWILLALAALRFVPGPVARRIR